MKSQAKCEDFSNLTDIQKFFFGQSVFITGVTGLVGKVVLEKILRCCPGVGMVYVHMRPKKGLTPTERINKLFNLELFRVLKDVLPDFQKHVQVVEGDITKPRLGLSFEDFEDIRQNVSIVIHTAASTAFNDPIKIAVDQNLIPVDTILNLCHEMPQLKAMVHVSTIYTQIDENGTVLEEIAKCKLDPEKLVEALSWMDKKCQDRVEEFLLDNSFGQLLTYQVSKAMAEFLIEKKRGDLPVAILKPCYVGSTWKEPFPGWIDAIQGVSGIVLAIGKGVLRTIHIKKDERCPIVPVDAVANAILSSAWHVGTTKSPNIFVMNCIIHESNLPYVEKTFIRMGMEKKDKYPSANIFRYPSVAIYRYSFLYHVHAVIDQWIPALIADFLLYIFTGKTILIKIYRKINFVWCVSYKLVTEFKKYRADHLVALENKLSEEDKKIFFISCNGLNWSDYLDCFLLGIRKNLSREDPSTIPYAKRKARIWLFTTTTLKWLLIMLLIYYLFL